MKKYMQNLIYTLEFLALLMPLIMVFCYVWKPDSSIASTYYLQPLTWLSNLSINNWYNTLLTSIGLTGSTSSSWSYILVYYPLYAMWVEIIELITKILVWLPHFFVSLFDNKKVS